MEVDGRVEVVGERGAYDGGVLASAADGDEPVVVAVDNGEVLLDAGERRLAVLPAEDEYVGGVR